MDDILHELLPLGLRQAPSQGLERGTHLDFLVRVGEETFDSLVIKRSQILLYRHELLLRVRRLHLDHHWHLWHHVEATVHPLHALRRLASIHRVEPVLELPLDRLHLLLEGVVYPHILLLHIPSLHHVVDHSHLLLVVLDEGRLRHVDAVLPLDFVAIVDQERFVSG